MECEIKGVGLREYKKENECSTKWVKIWEGGLAYCALQSCLKHYNKMRRNHVCIS